MVEAFIGDTNGKLPEPSGDFSSEDVYVFPTSFAQKRLWFLDQFEPGSPFYNIPSAVRLKGKLDISTLEKCVNEIVNRHEALRTTFTVMEGDPVQVIHPEYPISVPLIDLTDPAKTQNRLISVEQREVAALRIANEEARKPFDLKTGPLLRVTLIRLNEADHVVLITMHHIVSDGWSMGVLISELSVLYAAFSAGMPSPLPELPIQYADFAEWQQNWLQGEVLERQIEYWKKQLGGGSSILELPTDRPRPAVLTSRGSTESHVYPKDLMDGLHNLSRRESATMFMTLMAAFQVLLYRYTRQEDISVGTPIANRNRAEIEGLIGIFINTLVLRGDLSGNPTFRDFLRSTRERALEAFAYQDLPFEMLVDELQPERDMSHTPLFQVMFIMQTAPTRMQKLPELTLELWDIHSGTSTFDITLTLAESLNGLDASIEYNIDMFDPETIQGMLSHYEILLRSIIANPDQKIGALELLTPQERQLLLVEWNQTCQDFAADQQSLAEQLIASGEHETVPEIEQAPALIEPWNKYPGTSTPDRTGTSLEQVPGQARTGQDRSGQLCVHRLFQAQAANTPDALAVILPAHDSLPRQPMTYHELDERSSQLARYLKTLFVGPETVVGVSLDRSLDLIVALMGILKAGGAYLPLDPMLPKDRLAYMIADSGTNIILTRSDLLDRLPDFVSITLEVGEIQCVSLDEEWEQIMSLSIPESDPRNILGSMQDKHWNQGELSVIELDEGVNPGNMVYMTYTSGSTGQSKGVIVQHLGLVNAYLAWEKSYKLRNANVHLQMANFSFDVFSGDLVRALCSGGTLVLCPREWLLEPERLYQLIVEEKVDCAEFVPVVLRYLTEYLLDHHLSLESMEVLACGSDSWYVSEYLKFRQICGAHTRLINSFGLTEATIDSTFFEGPTSQLSPEQLVPIGRPFANTRLYILDQNLQPVPIGVPGELHVAGPGLARGYHNRPEMTGEKFIPDPFGIPASDIEVKVHELTFSRLYKTGDLARYLRDGNVEFLGRIDEQLKIRGFRIEPGEIEAVIGSHPDVREAAVLAIEVTPGDKRLVAYIELEGETDPDQSADFGRHVIGEASDYETRKLESQSTDISQKDLAGRQSMTGELRRLIQERLPDYMVPAAFVFLGSLPLNASGKIDRRALEALPPPDFSQRELDETFIAPRTALELQLAQIWCQVLGINGRVGTVSEQSTDHFDSPIGIHDNFFELGGHSLLATQLVSRIRGALQVELPLRNIFESPTIATLAEKIKVLQSTPAELQVPPIVSLSRDLVTGVPVEPPPLSFAQQRLWFLDQLEPGSPFYNLPEAVRVYGEMDAGVLERSLNAIVRRHEALRTTFQVVDGKPVQVIASEIEVSQNGSAWIKVEVDDLCDHPEDMKETEALRIAQQEAQTPFDLTLGPLLRARLIHLKSTRTGSSKAKSSPGNSEEMTQLSPDIASSSIGVDHIRAESIILLTMHHIVGDNWSTNVLTQELAELYDAYSRGSEAVIPPFPIQYADFAAWQRNWLRGEVLQRQLNYWKSKLANQPPLLELPTDRPRPSIQSLPGDYRTFELSDDLSEAIVDLAQKEGATLFMFLLAAFKLLLYRYSGQTDISIGTPIANRNRGELEGLIGFFVNTLVLRSDLNGEPSFRELLNRVKETALGAYGHQDVPFEMVVDAVQPQRDMSHSPLFQVMFTLQSTMRGGALPGSVGASSGESRTRLPASGIMIEPYEAHSGTAKFDLTLFMNDQTPVTQSAEYTRQRSTVMRSNSSVPGAGRAADRRVLSGAIEFNTDLFDATTIERMLRHFEILLRGIVSNPDMPISHIPMLSDRELHQLIVDWNDTTIDLPSYLAHELFETQVEKTPDSTAITYIEYITSDLQVVESSLTYAELNQRANLVAHYLLSLGAGPEIIVGVCMKRSIEMMVALLGIMKAGGAYLPLDPTYPIDRLEYMISDSGMRILLTQADLIDDLPQISETQAQVICIDKGWNLIESNAQFILSNLESAEDNALGNPRVGVSPDHAAYVIYTSGSTGQPKGTVILHHGLINYLYWCDRAYPLDQGGGAPVHSSISFDLTITGLFSPLITGRRVFMLPEGLGVENLGLVLKAQAARGADPFSLIKITPAHLQLLGEELTPAQAQGRTHAFIIGGENLLDEHLTAWREHSPDTQLVNEYGPTETVVGCCVYWARTEASNRTDSGVIPIGRPINNTQLYILDEYFQPVPVGVVGELYIGGAGVARGYLNRPDLTAERFVPNPFYGISQENGPAQPRQEIVISGQDRERSLTEYQNTPGEANTRPEMLGTRPGRTGTRLYRTGDLARYLPDGNILCLGRVDFQVKIRGFRVELGEIEARLASYPGVKDAVAWIREDAGVKRLVAYIVPEEAVQETIARVHTRNEWLKDLRDYLQTSLPEYMIPSAFMLLESIPLTANGKVDRKALPAPELTRLDDQVMYLPPRTPQEEIIAGIWAEILGIPQLRTADPSQRSTHLTHMGEFDPSSEMETTAGIGVMDNFFDLGGHSLLATQVISRLREAFQVDLPLRTIFEAPTIAGLAVEIDHLRQETLGLVKGPILTIPRDEITGLPLENPPLSFAQQRLWFLDQLDPGSPVYNIPVAVRLSGKLDVEALEKSLNQVIARHEALRTTFAQIDGRPYQVINPFQPIKLQVINGGLHDKVDLKEETLEMWVAEFLAHEASQSFDLEKGPLYRIHLLRLSEEEHIALVNMHHIISDDWSLGIFIREVASLYRAYAMALVDGVVEFDQTTTFMPDLPIQYTDFASWQRNWLAGDILEQQLAYWKVQLAGLPPLLDLPTDKPRPAMQTFSGDQETFVLSKDISEALYSLGRQEGATLFMVLLAALQILLSRYSGEQDISVGTPIANRTREELEGLIGFFVNTLVMRTDLNLIDAPNQNFRQVLSHVREVALGAYAHQDVPFEMVVDALQPDRDMSHSPLFQVMLVLQNAPRTGVELSSDLVMKPVETHDKIARFDLTMTVVETPAGLQGSLEYNTDLFEKSTITRMVGHFQNLLFSIVDSPEKPISQLGLMDERELRQVLSEWNDTEKAYPLQMCAHTLFEEQVRRTPEAIAVDVAARPDRNEGSSLCYRELNQKANQLARHLVGLGVGLETLVGICVERTPEMVIGLLGILKAGGAYLPLDPQYPAERLAFMMRDAGIKVLLTQERLLGSQTGSSVETTRLEQALEGQAPDRTGTSPDRTGTSPDRTGTSLEQVPLSLAPTKGGHEVAVIRMDADWEQIQSNASDDLEIAIGAENLAYVIYTSGSTGLPKGVMLQHQGLTNLVMAQTEGFGVDGDSRVLQFASFSFDASVSETFMALLTGATLVLAPQEELSSMPDLVRLLDDKEITTVTLPPSLLKELPVERLSGVKTLISAGEACTPEVARSWKDGRRFFNAYGPTETTVGPTYYDVSQGELRGTSVPIGKPIGNMRIYLLDQDRQPVPVGVPGEICIAGVGVGRGYLNRAELTAEKFVPNPFFGEGERMYRTGDLGRYLPDGNIEYLGRIDQQVKVRGFRIELGEIEAILDAHPAIQASVVLARQDQPGEKRLVAYIVPEGEGLPSIGELRSYLASALPEYMLPSLFVELDEFPLTPSGKVDWRALPIPEGVRPDLASEYVAPRTPEEEVMARIWAEVLRIESKPSQSPDQPELFGVGVYDNFFELGGDSILSIQVIARANQAGLRLTPRQLFENPTVAGLVAVADRAKEIVAEQGLLTGELPLTPVQIELLDQVAAGIDLSYTVILEIPRIPVDQGDDSIEDIAPDSEEIELITHLSSPQPERFMEALRLVSQQHDALRLRFIQTEDGWHQRYADPEISGTRQAIDPENADASPERPWNKYPRQNRDQPRQNRDMPGTSTRPGPGKTRTGQDKTGTSQINPRKNPEINIGQRSSGFTQEPSMPPVPFHWVDLTNVADRELKAATTERAESLQKGLNLHSGPVFQIAYLDCGEQRPARLLMVLHPLVCDDRSWQIVLEDFLAVYAQISQGNQPMLLPKTTSYRYWANKLLEISQWDSESALLHHWVSHSFDPKTIGISPETAGTHTERIGTSPEKTGTSPEKTETSLTRSAEESPDESSMEGTPLKTNIPRDIEAASRGSKQRYRISLNEQMTGLFEEEVNIAYRTEARDILLSAMGLTLAGWQGDQHAADGSNLPGESDTQAGIHRENLPNTRTVWVELVGDGRDLPSRENPDQTVDQPVTFEEVDLTRTVGQFNVPYPVYLEVPDPEKLSALGSERGKIESDLPPALNSTKDNPMEQVPLNKYQDKPGQALGQLIMDVKEQLRAVPVEGLGYGLLRYLRGAEKHIPRPQVRFHYYGTLSSAEENYSPLYPANQAEFLPARTLPPTLRPAIESGMYTVSGPYPVLDVMAYILDGVLYIEWHYNDRIYKKSTIEKLAQRMIQYLQDLISHCTSSEAGGYTASDFADFGWGQEDLDDILKALGGQDE